MPAGTNVGSVFFDVGFNQKEFNSGVKSSAAIAESSFGSAFSKIGKLAVAAFSIGAIVNFGKTSLKVASELESAWTGLSSIVGGLGRDFSGAKSYLEQFTADGLIPMTDAVKTYKNLLLRGYDDGQIRNIMERFKDASAYTRQSSYTMGEAMSTAAEGLKNENSAVVDNVGVTKNVAKMWEEYAATIGKTANQLTMAEKRQAEYNGIMAETQFQVGDAAKVAGSYQGRVAQLAAAFTGLKAAVGGALMPLANAILPVVTTIINAFTRMFNVVSAIMAKIFGKPAQQITVGAAAGAAEAAEAVGGVGEAAEGAGKGAAAGAKKAKGALAAFDELNSLSTSDSGGGGGSGGGGSGGDVGFADVDMGESIFEDSSVLDAWNSKLLGIQETLKSFMEAFGLTDSFNKFVETAKSEFDAIKNKASESWSAIVEQAKLSFAGITQALKPLITPIGLIGLEGGRLLMVGLSEGIQASMGILSSVIVGSMKIIEGGVKLAASVAQPALDSLADFFVANSETIEQRIREVWGTIETTVTGYTESMSNTVVEVFGGMQTWFEENYSGVYDFFAGTWEASWAVVDAIWQTIQTSFEAVFGGITDFLTEHSTGITETIVNTWSIIWELVSPIWNTITATITSVFGGIKDFLASNTSLIRELFSNAWEAVWVVVKSVLDRIKLSWDVWGPTLMAAIQGVMNNIKIVFETVWNVIRAVFETVLGVINGLLNVFIGVFTGDWSRAWEGVKSIFSSIWEGIKGVFTSVWEGIQSAVSNGVETIKTVLSTAWEAVALAVSIAWNGISSTISGIWDTICGFFSGAWDTFTGIGKNIIEGLWEGIQGAWTWVSDKITGIWDSITGGVKSVLGIHSPSKVFAEIGAYTMEGFVNGMSGEGDEPDKVMSAVTNAITSTADKFAVVVQQASAAMMSNLTAQLTAYSSSTQLSVTTLLTWLTSTAQSFYTQMISKFREFSEALKSGFNDLKNSIDATMAECQSSLQARLDSMVAAARAAAAAIASAMSSSGGGSSSSSSKSGTSSIVKAAAGVVAGVGMALSGLGSKSSGSIPKMATGGLVDHPTLAMIGEAGKEAVLPLENNTGWMVSLANILADALVAKLAMANSAQENSSYNGALKLEIDGRELGEIMLDYVLQAANRRGMKLLLST